MNYKPLIEGKLWNLVEMQNNMKKTIKYCLHTNEERKRLREEEELLEDQIEMLSAELEEQ